MRRRLLRHRPLLPAAGSASARHRGARALCPPWGETERETEPERPRGDSKGRTPHGWGQTGPARGADRDLGLVHVPTSLLTQVTFGGLPPPASVCRRKRGGRAVPWGASRPHLPGLRSERPARLAACGAGPDPPRGPPSGAATAPRAWGNGRRDVRPAQPLLPDACPVSDYREGSRGALASGSAFSLSAHEHARMRTDTCTRTRGTRTHGHTHTGHTHP